MPHLGLHTGHTRSHAACRCHILVWHPGHWLHWLHVAILHEKMLRARCLHFVCGNAGIRRSLAKREGPLLTPLSRKKVSSLRTRKPESLVPTVVPAWLNLFPRALIPLNCADLSPCWRQEMFLELCLSCSRVSKWVHLNYVGPPYCISWCPVQFPEVESQGVLDVLKAVPMHRTHHSSFCHRDRKLEVPQRLDGKRFCSCLFHPVSAPILSHLSVLFWCLMVECFLVLLELKKDNSKKCFCALKIYISGFDKKLIHVFKQPPSISVNGSFNSVKICFC